MSNDTNEKDMEDLREVKDDEANITEEISNNTESTETGNEDEYEKICYVCRRPESKTGKMVNMPGGLCVCTDCLERSFNSFGSM